MRRSLLAGSVLATAAAVLLGGAGGAAAQPIQGLYVGAGAGANFLSDQRVRTATVGGATVSVPGGTVLSFDTGFTGLGSVGWGFGNGVRVEVEGSYRSNDLTGAGSGYEHKYGVMGNVLFDLDIGSPYAYPYLGAGAGYQYAEQKQTLPGASISGTKGSFAYQAIAGWAFPIPWVVGLSATAEYRYLGMAGDRSYRGTVQGAPPITIGRKVTENNNHSLLLGVRYAFNVPPPVMASAPAPAPVAVAPARSYLVFFDWDRADLSARAREIVAEAAQASTRVAVTRIEVDGHADRSGTPAYNQSLSRRRADNVAAELVRDGVPKANITVMAFGDTRPLVPTAPGVREAQNRRVEIIFR